MMQYDTMQPRWRDRGISHIEADFPDENDWPESEFAHRGL